MWRKRENTAKGLAAGLIGGLFASWVMSRFQDLLGKLKENTQDTQEEPQTVNESGMEDEPATVKTATLVATKVFRTQIRPEQKGMASNAVHYGYGAFAGGVYGMAAEKLDMARTGVGSVFGAVLWAISDEVAVPALGLSKGPKEYPLEVHASALASHLVYGVTVEAVRRALRSGILAD